MTDIAILPSSRRIVPGLSNDDYHSHPAVSSTILKAMLDCPARAAFLKAGYGPKSDALSLGTAVHTLVLEEPGEFNARYCLDPGYPEEPDDLLRTVPELRAALAGKAEIPKGAKKEDLVRLAHGAGLAHRLADAWKERVEHQRAAQVRGREVLTAAQMGQVTGMAAAVARNTWAKSLLEGAESEVSVFWVDEETGLECRVRPDAWLTDVDVVADLKTTSKGLDNASIARTIIDLGYDLSAAMYLNGTGARQFYWIFIQSFPSILINDEPAHACRVVNAEPFLERGTAMYRFALAQWATCQKDNIWPEYDQSIDGDFFVDPTITPPRWAL